MVVESAALRCERCGGSGVRTEWDDDDRKYVKKCQLCGRVQGSGPCVRQTGGETVTGSDNGAEAKPNYREWKPKAKESSAAPTPKANSAAAKALEVYNLATTRYLEASEKLQEAEQRRADAEARVVSCLDHLTSAQVQMREARAKLDQELSLLGSDGKPKPFSQRVKRRPDLEVKLEERPCLICGSLFRPGRRTQVYCSRECNRIGADHPERKRAPEASSPEATETSLQAIPEGAIA